MAPPGLTGRCSGLKPLQSSSPTGWIAEAVAVPRPALAAVAAPGAIAATTAISAGAKPTTTQRHLTTLDATLAIRPAPMSDHPHRLSYHPEPTSATPR